jgi:hypothetical protein
MAPVGSELSASLPGRFPPRGKTPQYPLDRRLGAPQSGSGRNGEVTIIDSNELQPVSRRYTHDAVSSAVLSLCSNGLDHFPSCFSKCTVFFIMCLQIPWGIAEGPKHLDHLLIKLFVEECRLLECYAAWVLLEPTIRRNVAPPS